MEISDDLLKRISALVGAEGAASCPQGNITMPCEVTAAIPTYNAIRDLGDCVCALQPGHQSLPLKLMLAENGSEDGTQLVLRDLMKPSVTRAYWSQFGFRDIMVVEVPQNDCYAVEGRQRHRYNVRACYQAMVVKIDTPYVLFVDADVVCPTGAVRTMLEVLQADAAVGLVSVSYDFSTDHPQLGLAMMQTQRARAYVDKFTMKPPYPCMCKQLTQLVVSDGLKAVPLHPLHARHKRLEV